MLFCPFLLVIFHWNSYENSMKFHDNFASKFFQYYFAPFFQWNFAGISTKYHWNVSKFSWHFHRGGDTILKDGLCAHGTNVFAVKCRKSLWQLFYKQEFIKLLKRNNKGKRQEEIMIIRPVARQESLPAIALFLYEAF